MGARVNIYVYKGGNGIPAAFCCFCTGALKEKFPIITAIKPTVLKRSYLSQCLHKTTALAHWCLKPNIYITQINIVSSEI